MRADVPVSDGRELDPVAVVEQAAAFLGFVLPGDAEEIDGIDVPQADVAEAVLDLLRDGGRVAHLGEGGDENLALAEQLHRPGQHLFIDLHLLLQNKFTDRVNGKHREEVLTGSTGYALKDRREKGRDGTARSTFFAILFILSKNEFALRALCPLW